MSCGCHQDPPPPGGGYPQTGQPPCGEAYPTATATAAHMFEVAVQEADRRLCGPWKDVGPIDPWTGHPAGQEKRCCSKSVGAGGINAQVCVIFKRDAKPNYGQPGLDAFKAIFNPKPM